ncbi:MAG TPA: dTDP-4-dehydrorhamnose reductase [Thermoplasmata archaeon]|nr:dTDP-4-dehydrorhamnose reductase [Thermoplasmata archaeon]
MAKVLVVGGAGLLGQHLIDEAARRGHAITATHRGPAPSRAGLRWEALDLRDPSAISEVVRRTSPQVVLNAAALTDVDGCEDRPEEALTVNALAPAALAAAAVSAGARFVHVSTDYVFDGSGPATETTVPHPLGVYGRTKLEGERRVADADRNALLVRMSGVFGWNRVSPKPNSVTRILQAVEAGQEVRLFEDQRITPTYAKTAAQAMFDLSELGAHGVFHVASRDCVSRFEMGQAVVEAFGIPGAKLVPIAMRSVALKAARPPASCLSVKKVEETLKRPMPGFRACLEDMRQTR